MKSSLCIAMLVGTALSIAPAWAATAIKPPDSKETVVLQRVAIPGTNREMGLGIAEFSPNAEKSRHKATGPEVCYVLEGELIVEVDGKPAQHIRAGGSYQMPEDVVHVTRAGPAGAKVVATWAHVPGKTFNMPVLRN